MTTSKKTHREPKIGDRYQDSDEGFGDIWEITDIDDSGFNECTCVATGKNETLGDVKHFVFSCYFWVYLGNYSKDENLTNLYQILCE